MKSRRQIKIALVCLFLVMSLVAVLLLGSLIYRYLNGDFSSTTLLKSETTYVIMFAGLLAFIILLLLIINAAKAVDIYIPEVNLDIDKELSISRFQGNDVIEESQSTRLETYENSLLEKDYKEDENDDDNQIKADNLSKKELYISNSINQEEVNQDKTRFYMLSQIDKEYEVEHDFNFNNTLSLQEICNIFRDFSSYRLNLYYDISDIRRFIAGLATTHIIILQGMSGTGKTSLAYAFGEFLNNSTTILPIQPMWKERTDLIGYYNEFTKKFNETVLLQKLYEANYNDQIYITVLDEMNIARVEYYFAEFLSLLEIPNLEGRMLDVISDEWESDPKLLKKGQLRLPANMWFIGTANNDDSTFAISDKVYDRAMVINLDTKCLPFEAKKTNFEAISASYLEEKFKEAVKKFRITTRNLNRLQKLDEYMIERFHITFGNRIMKQIKTYVPVYVACGGDEVDALDDILSRKVFRKLESQNPVYVRSEAKKLVNFMDDLFGTENMKLCKEVIYKIERTV